MGILRNILWQQPKAELQKDRKVTFLELFYDLVYVIFLAHVVHSHVAASTWVGLGQYLLLFIPMFLVWLLTSLHHDINANNDLKTRIYTLLHMGLIIGVTVASDNAFTDDGHRLYALLVASQFLIIIATSLEVAYYNKRVRPYYTALAGVLGCGTLTIGISALLNSALWLYIYCAGLLICMCNLTIVQLLLRRVPSGYAHTESMRERFGLFMIIVLGELIVGIVGGVAHAPSLIVLSTIATIVLTLSIWWVYFDYLAYGTIKLNITRRWNFGHAVIFFAIPLIGVAFEKIIGAHIKNPLFTVVTLGGALVGFLAAAKLIFSCLDHHGADAKTAHKAQRTLTVTIGCIMLQILLWILQPYTILLFLLGMVLTMLIPVCVEITVWIYIHRRVHGTTE